jgi:PAS domain S-box-containing protein
MRLGLREFRHFVEGSTAEVYLVRADGRIAWANDAAVQSLGYPQEQLFNLSLRDIAPSTAGGLPERFAQAREGELPPYRTTHIASDGTSLEKGADLLRRRESA